MKLKRFSLVALFIGVLLLVVANVVPFALLQNDISKNGPIGIIGGADTPTYEFVVFHIMNGWPFVAILFGITLIVSALF